MHSNLRYIRCSLSCLFEIRLGLGEESKPAQDEPIFSGSAYLCTMRMYVWTTSHTGMAGISTVTVAVPSAA